MLLASITQDVGDFLKQGYNSVVLFARAVPRLKKSMQT